MSIEAADRGSELETFVMDSREDATPGVLRVAGATADPVKDYLQQIGRVPLLNAELEVELSKDIEAGLLAQYILNPELEREERVRVKLQRLGGVATTEELEYMVAEGQRAKAHMIEANLRLVVSLAKRYTGRGMQFLDIVQEGNIGLNRAVEKFDYKKGYKFSTYATWWVRQSITRSLADQGRTIRVPVHMTEVINKMVRVQRQMLQDLGRKPTTEELAGELDMTTAKLTEIQSYNQDPISLHMLLGKDGDAELGDVIEDQGAVDAVELVRFNELRSHLSAILETLTPRDAGIIDMRYGLTDGNPKTLGEIGEVYGVTRERIRQLEVLAMRKLRTPENKDQLQNFLDLE